MGGRLEGKVAFITGAGTGIGRAAAMLFAREGASVVVAEIDEASGRETELLVADAGGACAFVRTDVTDATSVEAAVAATVERFGALHVLYNNAGGSTLDDGPVTEAPVEEFWRAIRLDLFGTFLACKHGIPRIVEAGGGAVVNTASNVALMALPGRDCYTAAKGGIVSLTRSMAAEYARDGVRVNAVAPSGVNTERVRNLARHNEHIERLVNQNQLFGWVQPEHVAALALYLASDEAASTTGQTVPVDGGATII